MYATDVRRQTVSDERGRTARLLVINCDHITPQLRQLHWLTISWGIDFKLAVLVYKCLHGLAPSYLADELHHPAESEFRRHLRSASSHELSVPRTRLSTYGDRAFPVAAVRSDLELSSAARHIRAVTSRLLHLLEDILLRTVLFIKLLSSLRSDIVIKMSPNVYFINPWRHLAKRNTMLSVELSESVQNCLGITRQNSISAACTVINSLFRTQEFDLANLTYTVPYFYFKFRQNWSKM